MLEHNRDRGEGGTRVIEMAGNAATMLVATVVATSSEAGVIICKAMADAEAATATTVTTTMSRTQPGTTRKRSKHHEAVTTRPSSRNPASPSSTTMRLSLRPTSSEQRRG